MKNQKQLAILVFAVLLSIMNSCKKESNLQYNKSIASKPTARADSMVQTPSGLMVPKSHIHMIEDGFHLEIRGDQVLKIKTKTGALTEVLGKINSPLVGKLSSPADQNAKALSVVSAPGGAANGWVTFAQLHSTSLPINYISTTWQVPADPSKPNDGQLFYIFDGLEPATGSNIIQPVLQWGYNGYIGGSYWCIANWYGWTDVSGNGYYAITSPITVTSGTSLQGIINFTGNSGTGSNNFTSTFSGYANSLNVTQNTSYSGLKNGAAATVTIPFIDQQFYAYETLEAYNISTPYDYPPILNVPMSNISVLANNSASTASWNPFTNSSYAIWGEHTDVTNNSTSGSGQVQLWFHNAGDIIPVTTTIPSNPNLHAVVVNIAPTNTSYLGANLTFNSTSSQNYANYEPSHTYNIQVTTVTQRCHVTINNTYTQDTQGGHTYVTFNNITLYGSLQVSVVPF